MVCIYGISIFCSVPRYVVNRLDTKYSLLRNKARLSLIFMKHRGIVEKISIAINNSSIPLLSFIIIIISTKTLLVAVKKASKWRRTSSQTQVNKTRNQKVAKMVVIVSTLFIFLFYSHKDYHHGNGVWTWIILWWKICSINFSLLLGEVSIILKSINSSSNIFIYCHMSSKYRKQLDMLCWRTTRACMV